MHANINDQFNKIMQYMDMHQTKTLYKVKICTMSVLETTTPIKTTLMTVFFL